MAFMKDFVVLQGMIVITPYTGTGTKVFTSFAPILSLMTLPYCSVTTHSTVWTCARICWLKKGPCLSEP